MVEGLLSRHDTLGFHYGQGVLTSDQATAYISGQHLGLHFRNYRLRPLYIETSLTTFQGGLTTNNDFHVDLDDENLRILWFDLAFGLKIQGKGVYLDLRLFNFRKYEHQSYLKKTERSLVGPAGIGLGFAL
jgi:hypothetical protein